LETPLSGFDDKWWSKFELQPITKSIGWKKEGTSIVPTKENDYHVRQYYSSKALSFQSSEFTIGFRISPYEQISGYRIDSEKLIKVRNNGDKKYFVTSNPAMIYEYDINGFRVICVVKDACYLNDKVYIIDELNNLVVIDTTSGELNSQVRNLSESKTIKSLEVIESNVITIYEDNQVTSCYKINDIKKLWELSMVYDRIDNFDKFMYFIKDKNFYTSTTGGTEIITIPVVNPIPFQDNIMSIYGDSILISDSSSRSTLLTRNSINAFTNTLSFPNGNMRSFSKNYNNDRIIVGDYSKNNFLDISADLTFREGKALENSEVSFDSITGIERMDTWEKMEKPATGSIADGTYVPALWDSRYLIFTRADNQNHRYLFVLEKNNLIKEDENTILVSKFGNISILIEDIERNGTTRVIPESSDVVGFG